MGRKGQGFKRKGPWARFEAAHSNARDWPARAIQGPLLSSRPPRTEADDLTHTEVSVSDTGLLRSSFQTVHLHFNTGI